MPLSSTNTQPGNIVKSADIIQFFNLFTGAMTDQAVSLKNQVTVGGNQGASTPAFTINGVAAQTADYLDITASGGAVGGIFKIPSSGVLTLGSGLTITSGGETIQAGGLTVTAGGVTVSAGGLTVTAGNAGIGVASNTNAGLTVSGSITTTIAQYGVVDQHTGSSAATSEISSFFAQPATTAASFTCVNVVGFHATNPIKGASSVITNASGLLVDSITSGASNFGVYIGAPGTGTNSSNLRMAAAGAGTNIISVSGIANPASSYRLVNIETAGAGAMSMRTSTTGGSAPGCTWQFFTSNGTTENATAALILDGNNIPTFGQALVTTATAGAQALPASPAGFLIIQDSGGTTRKIPCYNN